MRQKKGWKFFFVFLVVFGFESMSLFHAPMTQTRYYDEEENALLYRTKLYSLYKGNFFISSNQFSNYLNIALQFSFPKNNVVEDTTKDLYEVIVPNGCYVKSMTSTLGSGNGNKILYQNPAADNVLVDVRCTVTSVVVGEEINVPISIFEQVGEESKFLYMEGIYKQFLSDYRLAYPIPTVDLEDENITIPTVAQNRYDSFLAQIRLWGSVNAPSINPNILVNYVKTVYPDEESLFDLSKSLLGLQVTKKEGDLHDEYIYTILENFAGYANTYAYHTTSPNWMFFTTQVASEIDKAFAYYLKNYTYPQDDYSVQLILDYVKQNGGVSSIVLPQADGSYKTIAGLSYNPSRGQLVLDSILVDIATPTFASPVPIRFGTSLDMSRQLNVKFPKAYGEDMISSDARAEVLKHSLILQSVTKNNSSESSPADFEDQYLYYDEINEHYLLFDIYSLIEQDAEDTNNYIDVTSLEIAKEVAQFKNNADGTLGVEVHGLTKEEVLEEIKRINDLLDASVLDKDIVWEPRKEEDGTESVIATYSISKQIIII